MNSPSSAYSMIDGSSSRVTVSSSPRNAPPSRMLSRPVSSLSKPAPRVSRPDTWPSTSTAPSDGRMIPARTWSSVLLPAPLGPMTASDSPRWTRRSTWRSAQNCSAWPRPSICAERAPDGRLLGEAQVVPDAEVVRRDGVVGRRFDRGGRRSAAHQMTFAKLGSRRLKTIVVRARKIDARRRAGRPARPSSAGRWAGRRRRPVDHRPVGLEQDRERVGVGERRQDRDLLEDPRARRGWPGCTARATGTTTAAGRGATTLPRSRKKTLPAATRNEHARVNTNWTAGDDRDEQQVRRDPVRVEEHQHAQRDGPEGEADDAGGRRRDRQDELGELRSA